MKITRVLFCLFALLLALVAFAFTSSAPQAHAAGSGKITKFRLHGLTATAFFEIAPVCIDTTVFVSGTQSGKSSVADVFITQFNFCTGTMLLAASGSTSSPDFQISRTLDSASLQATIAVFDDVSGKTFNVSVDTTWTATGPLSRENQSFHFHTKGVIDNAHLNATFRDATALGTVSDGTTDFTPEPAVGPTQIAKVTSGEVTITHS